VVDSLYGKLIRGKILMDKNSIVGSNNIIGPGTIFKKEYQVGDASMTFMKWPLDKTKEFEFVYFSGTPAKQVDFKKFFAQGSKLKEEFFNSMVNYR
ncbi:MAG: hypothetical protein ACTSUK_09340, partial [Promethearchaeota archaeon]